MNKPVPTEILHKIMDRAIEINQSSAETCRDFTVMASPKRKNTLILRWLSIDLSNPRRIKQTFFYECFTPTGDPMYCSVFHWDQDEANGFFVSLKPLYGQKFAMDHKR